MVSILYAKVRGFKKNLGLIVLMTIFPIALTMIFGLMNSGGGKQTLPIFNEDNSIYASQLINEIESSNIYRTKEMSYEEAEKLVENQDVFFALIIPKGFKEAIEKEEKSNLVIVRSVETLDLYGLQGVLNGAIQKVVVQSNIVNKGIEILNKYNQEETRSERFYELVNSKWEGEKPISVRSKILGEDMAKNTNDNILASIGLLLFFSMYPIIFTLGDILEEKRLLIWDRLIISPISKLKIYTANLIYAFVTGAIQITILILLSKLILHITWTDNIVGLTLLLAAFIFTTTGLGLLFASVVKTYQQFSSVVPVIVVSTSMLGGLMWPIEIITNKTLLFLAKLTPQFWTMDAMAKLINYNAPTLDIIFPIMVLFLMGILFMGIGLQISEGK